MLIVPLKNTYTLSFRFPNFNFARRILLQSFLETYSDMLLIMLLIFSISMKQVSFKGDLWQC